MVEIIVSEPGDHHKLVWELMALLERAEQKKDLAILQDRFYLAKRAGFKLREQMGQE